MHVVAGFESSTYLEIALVEIKEQLDIADKQVTFIQMTPQEKPQTFLDSIHYSDGSSSLDSIGVGGVLGGVLGIIYGSVLWMGSLAIGVIGCVIGGLIGFFLDKWIGKRRRTTPIRHIEILLLIRCQSKQHVDLVYKICRKNHVISLGVHP